MIKRKSYIFAIVI